MKALHFTASLLALLPAIGCVLPGDDDEDGAGDTDGASGATAPSTSNTTAPGTDDGTTANGSSDGGSESGNADSTGDSGNADSTGGTGIGTCESATLLMGNPYFDGDLEGWNKSGQPLLADPPLRNMHLADSAGHLVVDTSYDIWGVDGDNVRLIAGDETEFEVQYQPSGPCSDVRFIITEGVAALPGNRLVVADRVGNGLVEITDPFGDCTAAPIAGMMEPVLDVDLGGDVGNPGDTDGPGAQAQFYGVTLPVADAEGNVYVLDTGNADIKRVSDDADRTVTTLFHYGSDDVPLAMTAFGGTLYVTGADVTTDWLWAIDVETGEQTEVYRGRGLFEELDSSQQVSMFALENDGTDLLVASNKGYIFRLSTAAEPLGVIAGYGSVVDYPEDLDLTMPIPVGSLPIHSYGINEAGLLRMGSDLLFTNVANGIGFHVWSIACE